MKMKMVDISKVTKEQALAALYNASHPQGIGFINFVPGNMDTSEAKNIIEESGDNLYFDYLKGRVLKVDLSGNEFDPWLFDRDNFDGAAQKAISSILPA
jgi:hypothetical protein